MPKVLPMVSLELCDDDQYDAVPVAPGMDKPRFPYGTRMSFEDAQLQALGLDPAECVVGGVIHIHAMARITSTSQNDTEGGKRSRVEVQVEEMCCLESEDEENEEAEEAMGSRAKRRKLYRG